MRNHDELTLDKLSDAARGGLCCLRVRPGYADLRPRAEAPTADNARRRPASYSHGVQPLRRRAEKAGAPPRPLVEGAYGPAFVNVAAQRHDTGSLLMFMSLLARRYRECPEFGWGEFSVLDQPNKAVLAHRSTLDDASLVAVHNFGDESVSVRLRLTDCVAGSTLVDLLREGSTAFDGLGRVELTIEPYGYRWLRVVHPDQRRLI